MNLRDISGEIILIMPQSQREIYKRSHKDPVIWINVRKTLLLFCGKMGRVTAHVRSLCMMYAR